MPRLRALCLILAAGVLSGCGENVDLLYYPAGEDRRDVRVIRNLSSLEACERRAREIAGGLNEARRARADFECGVGAHDHPNFGRRYEERVALVLDLETDARDTRTEDSRRRLDLSGAAFADDATIPAPTAPWQVQVGSFRAPADAGAHVLDFGARHEEVVRGRPLRVFAADLGDGGVFYRVRLTDFAERGEARRVCARLRDEGADCFVARAAPAG